MISATSLAGLECGFEHAVTGAGRDGGLLGAIEYSSRVAGPIVRDGHPFMAMPMGDDEVTPFAEVWRTTTGVVTGQHRGLAYACDGEYLFLCGRTEEDADLVTATEEAYLAAFEVVRLLGYPHLARMWNMVHRINEPDERGGDVYGRFCKGRALAFERGGVPAELLPAATCVGSHGGGVAFYLLACRTPRATHIENPRQTPAYRYPPKYGVKAPSFARATYLAEPDGTGRMFVSGTASIIGSETVHKGDMTRQTTTTLENIAILVGRENLSRYGINADLTLRDLDAVKVYVKHKADIPMARRICADVFAEDAGVAYVNVDICRDDLLVEIEAVASRVHPS
ncbi:FkbO/Hyg5 family chorismatase [Sphaerisporangium aureirubrum]|uniref:FkbO/Hyg5 family chorismatase n=1 Tax=Sphaerisporangium aureirubrum TaxID=1544736 RepID=A0ABW1NEU1_9ACTN